MMDGHGREVLLRGVLVSGPSLAHHIEPHGTMRNLCANIDCVGSLVEQIEVLAEGLPLAPGHPDAEGGARDVFDSFHQVDQCVVVSGPYWGEADATVAHHEGCHTVGS